MAPQLNNLLATPVCSQQVSDLVPDVCRRYHRHRTVGGREENTEAAGGIRLLQAVRVVLDERTRSHERCRERHIAQCFLKQVGRGDVTETAGPLRTERGQDNQPWRESLAQRCTIAADSGSRLWISRCRRRGEHHQKCALYAV